MAAGSAIRRRPAAGLPGTPWHLARGCAAHLPVPAGGMTLDRVPEMLDFYGRDAMLLIGGSLLAAGEHLTATAAAFARAVAAPK